ncbi:hypothetical protein Tco_0369253 [Tanacetum coccineum]
MHNIWHSCKVFMNLYKPYQQQLQNFFKLLEQDWRYHYQCKTTISVRAVWESTDMTIVGAGKLRSQRVLKTMLTGKDDDVQTRLSIGVPLQAERFEQADCNIDRKQTASLNQELKECRNNLDETGRALREATSCRDSCLIALQNKQNEFEKFCPNGEETVTLEKESRSKLNKDTVKPYDYTYQNSLYEIFKPPSKTYLDQLERAK